VYLHAFSNSTLEGGKWLSLPPVLFPAGKEHPVTAEQLRRSGWFGEQKNSCPYRESNDGSSVVHFVDWAIPQHCRVFMLNVAVELTVSTKYQDT
jgi:hypothetical protein